MSNKSKHSRVGSAKSQKSVVWSTGEISDIGSEFGLLDEKDEPKKEKKGCFHLISGNISYLLPIYCDCYVCT